MMYKKMQIGDVDVMFCSCASINVCYYNIFHDDFIKEIMSFTLSYCQRNGTLVSTEDIFKEWDKDEEDYINED